MDAMSCLAPPPASFDSFLPTAASPAYYTDAAIARALHYSISDHYSPAASASSPSSSSSLLADFPCSAGSASGGNWFAPAMPAPPPTCDSVLVASDAAPRPPSTPTGVTNKRRQGLGVTAGTGRAGKRRPRASKRAPTTYITTDTANFRLMVQHATGVQAEPGTADDGLSGVLMPAAAGALMDSPTAYGGAFEDLLRLPSGEDAAALQHRFRQQQEQQPCFPTLDSWSVMYETSGLL